MQACDYPISFIIISVGPEDDLSLDKLNNMRGRKFDNVHCINYFTIQRKLEKQRQLELKHHKAMSQVE